MNTINSNRLWQRLTKLSEFTKPDLPWTRRAFSDEYKKGREWLTNELQNIGLKVRIDHAGNLIATLPGSEPDLDPIYIGSHSDTVTSGGRFDGIAGVITAIEIANTIKDSGHKLRHDLAVVDFLSEEPSDFGISCIGSRAITGDLPEVMLDYTDDTGTTLRQAIQDITGKPVSADKFPHENKIHSFLELHIEQGPLLEHLNIPIGIVTHIVGINRYEITIHGQAGHAGTTPMDMRADALVGAANLICAIKEKAIEYSQTAAADDNYFVATVGKIHVHPNNSNVIPAVATLTLEVRSTTDKYLSKFIKDLDIIGICTQNNSTKLDVKVNTLATSQPVACSKTVMDAINVAADRLGYKSKYMPSGAGHDAAHMGLITASGMIFIPCKDGRSHCPEEWADQEQVTAGANVALQTILELDQK